MRALRIEGEKTLVFTKLGSLTKSGKNCFMQRWQEIITSTSIWKCQRDNNRFKFIRIIIVEQKNVNDISHLIFNNVESQK